MKNLNCCFNAALIDLRSCLWCSPHVEQIAICESDICIACTLSTINEGSLVFKLIYGHNYF